MNITLIVLVTILVCVAIVLCIYLIVAFRKMHIVAKKLDYLVEDLTYKAEQISPLLDSANKITNFLDVLDEVLKHKSQNFIKQTSGGKESIYKVAKEVKEEIKKIK